MTHVDSKLSQSGSFMRPEYFRFENGEKAPLPFSRTEYDRRLAGLRQIMAEQGIEAAIITSMHGVGYYSGFLYCSFGRPYACVVTQDRSTTVSANIDGGQPWRRSADDNVVYTDWKRDNYWRAIRDVINGAGKVGIEGDHLTLAQHARLREFLSAETVDIAGATMPQRMIKSAEEMVLIREGARIADVGGEPDAASLKIWEANVGAHELGLSLIREGTTCSGICEEINQFFAERDLLQYRSFGYGHSFGVLSHYYGREAGLELREDIDTVLEPGMVVSMEPMLTLPEGTPGAGGYREHDIVVLEESGPENITGFPYGPEHNIVAV